MNANDLVTQLEAIGDFKVMTRLMPEEIINIDDGREKKIAIFLDIEST